MTIETNLERPLYWTVYKIPDSEILHPDELPNSVKMSNLEFNGKHLSLILPDSESPIFDSGEFIKDNRATKGLRKVFRYINDQIGISSSYTDDLEVRRGIIGKIKEQNPDLSPQILKSMKRSLFAYAYHTEKRIKGIEENNPAKMIKSLVCATVFKSEPDDFLRERKSANATALFDKQLGSIFKKALKKIPDEVKEKAGGISILKNGYEYYMAQILGNYIRKETNLKIAFPNSFVTLLNNAILMEQERQRKTKMDSARLYSDIVKIANEPAKSMEEMAQEYIENQIRVSSFFK